VNYIGKLLSGKSLNREKGLLKVFWVERERERAVVDKVGGVLPQRVAWLGNKKIVESGGVAWRRSQMYCRKTLLLLSSYVVESQITILMSSDVFAISIECWTGVTKCELHHQVVSVSHNFAAPKTCKKISRGASWEREGYRAWTRGRSWLVLFLVVVVRRCSRGKRRQKLIFFVSCVVEGGDGFFFTDLHLVLSKTDRRSREVLSLKKNRCAGRSRSWQSKCSCRRSAWCGEACTCEAKATIEGRSGVETEVLRRVRKRERCSRLQ
jgi:hypothetical protein